MSGLVAVPIAKRLADANQRLTQWEIAWREMREVMADGSLPWSTHLRRLDELASMADRLVYADARTPTKVGYTYERCGPLWAGMLHSRESNRDIGTEAGRFFALTELGIRRKMSRVSARVRRRKNRTRGEVSPW